MLHWHNAVEFHNSVPAGLGVGKQKYSEVFSQKVLQLFHVCTAPMPLAERMTSFRPKNYPQRGLEPWSSLPTSTLCRPVEPL